MFETNDTNDEEESTENESDGPVAVPNGPPPENEEEPSEDADDEFDADAAAATAEGEVEDDRADEDGEQVEENADGLGALVWLALAAVAYFLLDVFGVIEDDGNDGENDPFGLSDGV